MSDATAIIKHPDLRRYLTDSASGGIEWVGRRAQRDHRGRLSLLADLTVACVVAFAAGGAVLLSPAVVTRAAIVGVALLAAMVHVGWCATSPASFMLRNRRPPAHEAGFAAILVFLVSVLSAVLAQPAAAGGHLTVGYWVHAIAGGALWAGIAAILTGIVTYGVERSRIASARVVVIGDLPGVAAFSAELRSGGHRRVGSSNGCIIAGGFDDRAPADIAALLQLIVDGGVDTVALAIAPAETARLAMICETLADCPVRICLVIDWAGRDQANQMVNHLSTRTTVLAKLGLLANAGVTLATSAAAGTGAPGFGAFTLVELWRHPTFGMAHALKRLLDIAGSLVLLVVLAPLLLMIALAVRLSSPGPVLFRQWRFGRGSVPFVMYKFRTMDALRGDPTGAQRTQPVDPRVTRVGRLLRRTSLDELPQLFNVLNGEMSLVGPRPLPLHMRIGDAYYFDAVAHYRLRHRMTPGITGWAQINGSRGAVATLAQARRRIDLDVFYVRNWSLPIDLQILALTLVRGFLTAVD